MTDDCVNSIQECFADCTTNEEIALLYAELLCEIRKQLNFCITEKEGE